MLGGGFASALPRSRRYSGIRDATAAQLAKRSTGRVDLIVMGGMREGAELINEPGRSRILPTNLRGRLHFDDLALERPRLSVQAICRHTATGMITDIILWSESAWDYVASSSWASVQRDVREAGAEWNWQRPPTTISPIGSRRAR